MSNVFVRLFLYVLSPVLAMLAALLPGWGISYADGFLTVHVETLIGAIVTALSVSGAVFAKWGTR